MRVAMLAVLALFFLFLAWRFLQVRAGRRRKAGPGLAAIRDKAKEARAATEPTARAQRFVEAGDLAKKDGDPSLAVGYYLRALRADPGSTHAVEAIRGTLGPPSRAAFRRQERVYWRLLSRIPPRGPTRAAWLEVWKALGDLYGRGYTSPVRARAIRALLDDLQKGAA